MGTFRPGQGWLTRSRANRLFALLWLGVSGAIAGATAHAAMRVALVSSRPDAQAEQILDSALVVLSQDKELEMVERGEINRVLHEQELSLAGGSAVKQAVKAGELLHVDLFAVLEGGGAPGTADPKPLALVVFDAHTGVRYVDEELSRSNTPVAVTAAVREAITKSNQNPAKLRTLCLLMVRNVDLPHEMDRSCGLLGSTLERKLTALPDIAVLERGRLAQVNQERQLVEEANQLLGSLRMIQLDVSREGEGWRGRIALLEADGSLTNGISAAVTNREVEALAEALVLKVEDAQKAWRGQGGPGDRVAEGRKFYRETTLFRDQSDYLSSLQAMEAAFALAPDEPGYRLELVQRLCDGATEYFGPGFIYNHPGAQPPPGFVADVPTAISLGHRAVDVLTEGCEKIRDSLKASDPLLDTEQMMSGRKQDQISGMLLAMSHVPGLNDSDREGFHSIIRKLRHLRENVLEPFWWERATNKDTLSQYAQQIGSWSGNVDFEQLMPQEWEQERMRFLQRWLQRSQHINPPDNLTPYPPLPLGPLFPEQVQFLSSLEKGPDALLAFQARRALVGQNESLDEFLLYVRPMLEDRATPAGPVVEAAWDSLIVLAQGHLADESLHETSVFMQRLLEGPAVGNRRHEQAALGSWETIVLNHPYARGAEMDFLKLSRYCLEHDQFAPVVFSMTISKLQRIPEQRTNALAITDLVLEMLSKRPLPPAPSGHNVSNWISARTLERQHDIAEYQKKHNELVGAPLPALTAPWTSVRNLLDLRNENLGLGWILKPIVRSNFVYAAVLCLKENGAAYDCIQLERVPLGSGPPVVVNQTRPSDLESFIPPDRKVVKKWTNTLGTPSVVKGNQPLPFTVACLGEESYFLGSPMGVIGLPFGGAPPVRLCTTNGLPTDNVLGMAFLDGVLYVGLGQSGAGYLLSWDVKKRSLATLASSRRAERLSPFDDHEEFMPCFLMADVARHRVLIASNNKGTNSPLAGIWAFSPERGEFKRIFNPQDGPSVVNYATWVGRLNDDTLLFVETLNPVAQMDLRTDQVKKLNEPRSGRSGISLWNLVASAQAISPVVLTPPQLYTWDGVIWRSNPFQRVLRDGTADTLASPVPGYDFEAQEGLQPVDNGKRLMVADCRTIWVLDLPEQASENQMSNGPSH